MNVENDSKRETVRKKVRKEVQRISKEEVRAALKRTMRAKAVAVQAVQMTYL